MKKFGESATKAIKTHSSGKIFCGKFFLATEMSVGHDFGHALLVGQKKLTPPKP
jgi:hypothetical protein